MLHTLNGFWYLDFIKINKLHQKYGKGEGKRVLIIDSGINLVDGLEDVIALPKLKPDDSPGDASQVGHGTAVTSILKSVAPEARIYVLDVEVNNLNYDLQGFEWAAVNYDKYEWDVINVSRYSGTTQEYKDPFIYLKKKGVITCAITGNDGADKAVCPGYWAKDDLCIAVGACDKKGKKTDFSNLGHDVLLPGINIKYRWKNPPPKWSKGNGTSLASPIAAGMIACWSNGAGTIEEARTFLKEWNYAS